MSYSDKVQQAAIHFIHFIAKNPDMDPMEIATVVCETWEVDRLDMDEKAWEITNKK